MSKFKVGDKVRILDGSNIEDYTGDFVGSMSKLVGEVREVIEVFNGRYGNRVSYLLEDAGGFIWDERGLEFVQPKIIITTNGKTTTARLFEGKQLVKTAKSKCHSGDEFDFNIGASIALERLTGQILGKVENTLEENSQMDRFIAGKIALKVPIDKFEDFLKECEKRNLTWNSSKYEAATKYNPVKETHFNFNDGVVYMYHDDGCLEYCHERYGDYEFETWETAQIFYDGKLPFDWNRFAVGKIQAKVTQETIEKFLEECEAHDLKWGSTQSATDFNPFKSFDTMNPLTKILAIALGIAPDEFMYLIVEDDGSLKFSTEFTAGIDEYEFI